MKKYYELEKWDKAIHWDELLTFQKMDWMYAQWKNEKNEIRIGHSPEYTKNNDWIYVPLEKKD